MPLKVLVCGGRKFGKVTMDMWRAYRDGELTGKALEEFNKRDKESSFIYRTLEQIANEYHEILNEFEDEYGNWLPDWILISGGATGADTVAEDWAMINWVPIHVYEAEWEEHGKKAGILRNIEMLKMEVPDLVIAFPGGRGTADMVRRATKAGIPVRRIKYVENNS